MTVLSTNIINYDHQSHRITQLPITNPPTTVINGQYQLLIQRPHPITPTSPNQPPNVTNHQSTTNRTQPPTQSSLFPNPPINRHPPINYTNIIININSPITNLTDLIINHMTPPTTHQLYLAPIHPNHQYQSINHLCQSSIIIIYQYQFTNLIHIHQSDQIVTINDHCQTTDLPKSSPNNHQYQSRTDPPNCTQPPILISITIHHPPNHPIHHGSNSTNHRHPINH